MKKKLLILACFVLAIGTYATVTGVQNSVLIQNALANKGPEAQGGERYKIVAKDSMTSTIICIGKGDRSCK